MENNGLTDGPTDGWDGRRQAVEVDWMLSVIQSYDERSIQNESDGTGEKFEAESFFLMHLEN